MSNEYFEPIIGLEVHVELKTASKMFCGCSASYFGHEPNTHCCPVCLGLPGALPVPNRKAVEWCVMLGLALNCKIPEFSKFDRKNYFYPDLPKGYQISQYDRPLCVKGWLDIKSEIRNPKPETNSKSQISNSKRIKIRRVHMEEDTAKLIHQFGAQKDGYTLIDFNRSGVPLVEIVTEPDIRSSRQARVFLKKLRQIIRYLGISDADMEKGSLRIEPNISMRKIRNPKSEIRNKSQIQNPKFKTEKEELPSYKVEVKNINSFNFAKRAIDYEIKRQIEILKRGETPKQETRGWDEKKGETYSQRSKEEAHDYRYFPEPDIPPVRWMGNQISKIKDQIQELPDQKLDRFIKEYGLSEYDAGILTETREKAKYYEKSIKALGLKTGRKDTSEVSGGILRGGGVKVASKIIANWIINKKVNIKRVSPEELVKMIAKKTQKATISDDELEKAVKKVIAENQKAVADYKSGKSQVIMFLVGQVMRELKGQAKAKKVKESLIALLASQGNALQTYV